MSVFQRCSRAYYSQCNKQAGIPQQPSKESDRESKSQSSSSCETAAASLHAT
jgi:hypothetical protein